MVGNLFFTEIPRSSDDCVGLQELHNAVQYPDVISVMADTSLLANVDLELLDTDYKKMAFFANVTNLMYCHTLLLYGLYQAESPLVQSMPNLIPLLSTLDDGSWFSYLTLFSSVGYHVGQLGVIRYTSPCVYSTCVCIGDIFYIDVVMERYYVNLKTIPLFMYLLFSFVSSCIDMQYCILLRNLPPHTSKLPYDFSYGKAIQDVNQVVVLYLRVFWFSSSRKRSVGEVLLFICC